MNALQITRILEQSSRKIEPVDGQVKVIHVPDYKTVYIEQIGEIGRAVILSEFTVDGKICWAGYSQRSNTIFVSRASPD